MRSICGLAIPGVSPAYIAVRVKTPFHGACRWTICIRSLREHLLCNKREEDFHPVSPQRRLAARRYVTFVTLFPRCLSVALAEMEYHHATYTRSSTSSDLEISPTGQVVRWSSISEPGLYPPPGTHPIQIEVEAGDTLYLPAGWWHDVRQSGPTVIALNWWYDMEMSGMSWVMLSFLRGAHLEEGDDVEGDSL